jgi:outer membrane protein
MRSALVCVFALFAAPVLAQTPQAPTATPTPATRPRLELSLEDAVKRALESNADIAVERFGPESSAQSVREIEGAYDPFLTSHVSLASDTSLPRSVFAGVDRVESDTIRYNVGASKLFSTGATLDVNFDNTRFDTNDQSLTFNPSYSSGLQLTLVQPLLRNFFVDATRHQLRVAKKNREISDAQFRQTVLNIAANVRQRYYDYIYTIDNLQAQRKNLDLGKKFLDESQIKVRVGTLAPLDVVFAESEVAGREELVILAEAALGDAEDALKRAMFPVNSEETWNLEIVPTDRPSAEPVAIDAEGALARALANRTDVIAARKVLESAEYSVQYGRNQTLPGVDLVAGYGSSGTGGTQQIRDEPLGPVTRRIPGGYNDAFSQVFGRDYPSWSLGVNLSYPLGNRTARARAARFRVNRDEATANLRRVELNVAQEVRSATRAVESNFKRVESTRASRVLSERRLDAESKRFGAGMSTNFLVTQAQRDLALAEVLELRAIADYRKSLVEFELVQEAGGGGITFASAQ